jgi:hypothetical protein
VSAETITYVVLVLELDGDKQTRYAGQEREAATDAALLTGDYCRIEMWAGGVYLGDFTPKPVESRW